MVTYCLGSARRKRAYFEKSDGAVVLDNVEVLFCVSENGTNCFALGDVPFADFTVGEYLNYRRALCREKAPTAMLADLGIAEDMRLGKLSPVEMRFVMFLEKTAGHCDKTVVVNLDGARYTRKECARLAKMLTHFGSAYVCITDMRFLRLRKDGDKTLAFGDCVRRKRPAFYCARILAKRLGAKRVSVV